MGSRNKDTNVFFKNDIQQSRLYQLSDKISRLHNKLPNCFNVMLLLLLFFFFIEINSPFK